MQLPVGPFALFGLLLVGCGPAGTPAASETDAVPGGLDGGGGAGGQDGTDGTDGPPPDTATQLAEFYALHGGRDAFDDHHVAALEALLHAEDELAAGDRSAAQARIDRIFETMPLSDPIWREGLPLGQAFVGDPVAYYGLRMLRQVVEQGDVPTTGRLQLTAVVAPCADVTRPTLPELSPETVRLDLAPEILEDEGRRLQLVTALFRRWVHAMTGGLEVDLVIHELLDCTTVGYTDDGSTIVSYPDAAAMVASVPDGVAAGTDLWWVVAPSGVPGDGSGYGRHFITGGMGGIGAGLPLFLSDDAWFVRKPEHLGDGAYTEAELRAYQPQWFQHEFMHHVFRTWPEFGLEESGHQWFDRSTWPEDFVGVWEADYYAEAVEKRLLAASPSLAEGLTAPELGDPAVLTVEALVGSYQRRPVLNDWHDVTVSDDEGELFWRNAAGVRWPLELRDGGLYTGPECPYGVSEVVVESDGEQVTTLWFTGEAYQRL